MGIRRGIRLERADLPGLAEHAAKLDIAGPPEDAGVGRFWALSGWGTDPEIDEDYPRGHYQRVSWWWREVVANDLPYSDEEVAVADLGERRAWVREATSMTDRGPWQPVTNWFRLILDLRRRASDGELDVGHPLCPGEETEHCWQLPLVEFWVEDEAAD